MLKLTGRKGEEIQCLLQSDLLLFSSVLLLLFQSCIQTNVHLLVWCLLVEVLKVCFGVSSWCWYVGCWYRCNTTSLLL